MLEQIKAALASYPLQSAYLFGSYARGQQQQDSDIDVLVEFARPVSLFEVLAMEAQLSERLAHKVDIVERSALKPSIKQQVERDMIRLV